MSNLQAAPHQASESEVTRASAAALAGNFLLAETVLPTDGPFFLRQRLARLGLGRLKSAYRKVAVAAVMKHRTTATTGWLAHRLEMGTASMVSRLNAE